MEPSLQLIGRTITKTVEPKVGDSILQHAIQHGVDWQHLCTRGTCARCRCLIEAGSEYLEDPTEAEYRRLDPEEFEEGYRLGCQSIVKQVGEIKARNKTYF
ncbi:2Fe-2S iron-sulfur cluster-binding protein [Paenibacillus crassostreae]|uniref:Ferredoxin n=1 Tax=Paenibacillus crassostreae TaxID=1763538 RepID=A0A167DXJ2_9BACL|nr:2Fe-2S iron-sulfur cluster-binding protein [Paenibacillus crassostreae]AOZ91382.1 ferredoxin [Paenibacillus crassostreae]OAB74894.1 ferredoxin [Paenibacillus crassostreae]